MLLCRKAPLPLKADTVLDIHSLIFMSTTAPSPDTILNGHLSENMTNQNVPSPVADNPPPAPTKSPLSKDRQHQQSCNTAHLLSWISNNNKAVIQRTPSIISKVHSDTNTPSECLAIPDFYRLQTSMHALECKSDRTMRRGKQNWGWEGMTDRAIPTNPPT